MPNAYAKPLMKQNSINKENIMRIETASENDINFGQGKIMGAVKQGTNIPAWALPGRQVTSSREVAESCAREIDRLISRP